MIKLVEKLSEWILGHRINALQDEHSAAEADLQMSATLRASATRIGAEQRRRLAANGFGEAFEAAFYANDRRRRP